MLSSQEQRAWDDVERLRAMEGEEPLRPTSSTLSTWEWPDQDDLPVALAAGVWIAIALVLFGAVLAGLAVAAVTAVGWAVWHTWPRLGPRPPCGPARPAGPGVHQTVGPATTVPTDRGEL